MDILTDILTLNNFFGGACLSLVIYILWKVRWIIRWGRSLKKELAQLRKQIENSDAPDSQACSVIYHHCSTILKSWSPPQAGMDDLTTYVEDLASCYYPEASRPELRVSIGHLLKSIDKSLERFDLILSRPGFRILSRTSLKKIRKASEAYEKLMGMGVYKWYARNKGKFTGFSMIRLAAFPDPFSWIFYLLKNLTLLLLSKYLLIDLYLFVGKLAVHAYGEKESVSADTGEEDLERALSELSTMNESGDDGMMPEIKKIKSGITGFTSVLKKSPDFTLWKEAVKEAAEVIAIKYFPDSDSPLEEAMIGPLVLRTRVWIANIGKGENLPVAGKLYKTRLETLYNMKRFSQSMVPAPVSVIIDKTLKTYGWLKWPLKIYRFLRRGGMWKLAADVGWTAVKKTTLAFIYGKSFDRAVKEIDMVYSMSSGLKGLPPAGHSDHTKQIEQFAVDPPADDDDGA